jgi:hypothetical protein
MLQCRKIGRDVVLHKGLNIIRDVVKMIFRNSDKIC